MEVVKTDITNLEVFPSTRFRSEMGVVEFTQDKEPFKRTSLLVTERITDASHLVVIDTHDVRLPVRLHELDGITQRQFEVMICNTSLVRHLYDAIRGECNMHDAVDIVVQVLCEDRRMWFLCVSICTFL